MSTAPSRTGLLGLLTSSTDMPPNTASDTTEATTSVKPAGKVADYTNSGAWGAKAIKEAQLIGKVNVATSFGWTLPTTA